MIMPKKLGKREKLALELMRDGPRQFEELGPLINKYSPSNGRDVVMRLVSLGILTKNKNGLIALSAEAEKVLAP